jgi:hypothetical protein
MSQANGTVESSRNGSAKFDPARMLQIWQQSTTSMLRANERLLRGFMDVTKRQNELAQELMLQRMSALQPIRNDEGNAAGASNFAKAQIDHNAQGIERLTAGLREVANEIAQCFKEATRLLIEDATAIGNDAAGVARDAASASAHTIAQPAVAMAREAEKVGKGRGN